MQVPEATSVAVANERAVHNGAYGGGAGWQIERPGEGNQYPTIESGFSLVLMTTAIIAATLMQTLDTTIVNVALPIIQGNLGATLDEGAWVVTGYIISAVIVIPLTPWLQIRFGRRQYYSTAIIGFTIASMLCGISGSIQELIFWRIVQGAFGGGLIATAQATLRDTFPKSKFGLSQGLFSIGAIVGPAVGPTLGGWLTDNYSWNWVFFINVVPGIFAGTVMLMRLKNPNDPRRVPLDFVGLGLLIVGLGSLQYVLGEGQQNDWFSDQRILTVRDRQRPRSARRSSRWELFGTQNPVVDLRVLRYRRVAAGSVLAFAIGATLYGGIVIFPQYMQGVLGFTAMLSGELIFVRAAFIARLRAARGAFGNGRQSRHAHPVADRLRARRHLAVLVRATSRRRATTSASMVLPNIISGIGLAMLFIPISIAMLNGLKPQMIPKAAAFQSLSTAARRFDLDRDPRDAALAAQRVSPRDRSRSSCSPPTGRSHAFFTATVRSGSSTATVLQQASVMSFADCQFVLGVLAVVLMPLVFVLPRKRPSTGPVHVSLE